MKLITKQKPCTYTIYQAVDGTEFENMEECQKYESSAKGVLRGKFMQLVVDKSNEYELFNGDGELEVLAISIPNEKDKDVILQLLFLEYPFLMEENNSNIRKLYEDYTEQVYRSKDVLLMRMNYKNEVYMIGPRRDYINKLTDFGLKYITEASEEEF